MSRRSLRRNRRMAESTLTRSDPYSDGTIRSPIPVENPGLVGKKTVGAGTADDPEPVGVAVNGFRDDPGVERVGAESPESDVARDPDDVGRRLIRAGLVGDVNDLDRRTGPTHSVDEHPVEPVPGVLDGSAEPVGDGGDVMNGTLGKPHDPSPHPGPRMVDAPDEPLASIGLDRGGHVVEHRSGPGGLISGEATSEPGFKVGGAGARHRQPSHIAGRLAGSVLAHRQHQRSQSSGGSMSPVQSVTCTRCPWSPYSSTSRPHNTR